MIGIWGGRGHSRVRRLLSAYIDDEVSRRESEDVRAHLAVCDRCRSEIDSLRATVELLRQLPALETRRTFALADAPIQVASAPRVAWAAGLAASAAGLLLVALLVGDLSGAITQRRSLGGAQDVSAPLAATDEGVAAAALMAVAESSEESVVVERIVEREVVAQAVEIERAVKKSEPVVESEESLTAAAAAAAAAAAPAPAMAAAEEPTAGAELEQSLAAPRSIEAEATPATEPETREMASPAGQTEIADTAPSAQTDLPSEEEPSGLSLPVWQLEAAAGAIAVLLTLVAVWVYRRGRQPSGY